MAKSSSSSLKRCAAACMLVALMVGGAAAAGLTARRTGFGPVRPIKQVWTAAPGNVSTLISSCAWDGYECSAAPMAPIFAKGAPVINPENYPARANAFVAASDLFCSQFSESKCSWPCSYAAGVGCVLNGVDFYGAFHCPGSVLDQEFKCISPQAQNPAACMVQPQCSFTSMPTDPQEQCTSTYSANLTDNQRMYVFGNLEFNVMPRQLAGCCKGSVYKYKLANWCNAAFNNETGSATPESCAKVPGCIWDIYSANVCEASPQTDVSLQFAYQPADPLAPVISKLAGECAAITDAKTCSSYKPVAVDAAKVKLYLSSPLTPINTPVPVGKCPLPSVRLPNM